MDYEFLRKIMKDAHFTEKGINQYIEIRNNFNKIHKFYDEYCGSFYFSENDLFENINEVLMYLETHHNYCLISCDEVDGIKWILCEQDF